ncbi:MAG: peptidase family protein [Oscillospiraceae bacterium]|nr:peptidase family protein [Oscillospiraceae bacterium]
MINGMTEQEFILDPDTIDFVAVKNIFFEAFVNSHPQILMTNLMQGQYWLGYINQNDLPLLMEGLGNSFISSIPRIMGLLDRPALEASGIVQVQGQPYLNLLGNGVLIGFLDTGIDYTQDSFIWEDGTSKIQFIYDQTTVGPPPDGFVLGVEYTNDQINQALHSDSPYSIVPQKDTDGHGTFLASVAAGRKSGDFIGAAPESELIVVKLRKARQFYLEKQTIPPDQENAFSSSSVIVGIEYILQKASQLNRPVVICISLGTDLGSHNGASLLEEYLRGVAILRGVCICTAAGNECQTWRHMQNQLTKAEDWQNIDFKIPDPGGVGFNTYINIWNTASDRFSVSIRSPTGEVVTRVPAKSGTQKSFPLLLENSRVEVEYFFPITVGGEQMTIVRFIKPTPGLWTITVYGDIVLDGTFHAWLPINGFAAPGIEFLSATPYCTVTIPSTMLGGISCGAYDSQKNILYSNSSWGPTRTPITAPDLTAPGVNVGGFYPHGYGTMSGTSVSAAITAGAAALLMQWGVVNKNEPAMSTSQIRAYLLRGCDRSDSMSYPNVKWGYGSLNLMQTFNLMREQ